MFKKKNNQEASAVERKVAKPKKVKRVNNKVGTVAKAERKNLIVVVGTIVAIIALSATFYVTLSSLFSTETYYVLNQNIKAKELITPDMVTARETSKNTGPINALSMEDIQRGGVYSRYPLYAGDVIAESNAGPVTVSSLGVPDSWAITSFSIMSTDAVGGTLGRGDYVDLIGVNESGARYVFNNLLILEVMFVNEELEGNLDGQTVVGEAMHYTVGLPAEHVAHLHSALLDYEVIKVVKAPFEVNYAERDTSNLDQEFKYGPSVGNIDLFKGTDPTFTEIERDETGRPVNQYRDDEDILEGIDNELEYTEDGPELEVEESEDN